MTQAKCHRAFPGLGISPEGSSGGCPAAGKGTSPRRRSRCAWGTSHHLAERPDSAVHMGLVRSLGRTLPRCAGKWPGRRSKAPRGPAALRSRRLACATGTEAPAGRARGSPFPPANGGRGCRLPPRLLSERFSRGIDFSISHQNDGSFTTYVTKRSTAVIGTRLWEMAGG